MFTRPRCAGKLFVISGPSGSGKTTLAARILNVPRFSKKLARSISFTTRAPRPGEKNNRDYVFISREDFLAMRRSKKILEWTRYLGYYYGTAVETVERGLRGGKSLVLCIDVRGAMRVKRIMRSAAVTVFIKPPSMRELRRRICGRADTPPEQIAARLARAKEEMRFISRYDYVVLNKDLSAAQRDLEKIVDAYLACADKTVKR
jgi:guanylate kinase